MEKRIEIPEGMNLEINREIIKVSGNGKTLSNSFILNKINIVKHGHELVISAEKNTKKEKKIIGAIVAHIKKMFVGLNEDYTYKMEICNVHFPMTVKIDGGNLIIKNFLGEKLQRVAKIIPGVKVEMKGNIIEIQSHDKDAAGLTASNIELATKIRNRDRRIFQDGIFIIEKPGRTK